MSESERLLIRGVLPDGSAFRPSDWIERLSANLARFGADHRLCYAEGVQPCLIEGERCLLVARSLAERDPAAFEFIVSFARSNDLRIVEDRRRQTQPVANDRRRSQPEG